MLKLYNTLTKEKEVFEPIDKENNLVRIYSCGLTVYNYAHIGNMRTYIFMDLLRKVLKYDGYKLKHCMNITDVGHLTSDADEGEDKMAKSAREQHKSVYEIAKMYTEAYQADFKKLNIEDTEVLAKATDHIKEMEEYVKEIIANGYAYQTSKGVYYDTSKLPKYGRYLTNNTIDELKDGARIEVDPEKRNPQDFAIWIKAPENHIMKWDSPWGVSYPGWHLECSVMGRRFLGEHFDIHTGGVDHIPIHHENEIAQDIGSFGHNPANFWMHVEFLLVDGGKMSKSLGNIYTISQLAEKGYEPLAFKLFNYTSSYRIQLNFTFEGLQAAKTALNRLRRGYLAHRDANEVIDEETIKEYEIKFNKAINDDLNMPAAMSVVWEIVKNEKKSKQLADLLLKFDQVLGLDLENSENYLNEKIEVPQEIIDLVEERKNAKANKDYAKADELRDLINSKANKDYAKADELRDLINSKGYSIKDSAGGEVQIEKI
jgi:cysteinyl-tRNA synthetase